MGATEPVFQQPRAATATAKARRNKTPKPQSRCIGVSNLANIRNKRGERNTQRKPLGLGTRPGAHQQMPITIDSEDNSDIDATSEAGASLAARLPVAPASQAGVHARRTFANSSNNSGLRTSNPNFEMSSAAPLRRTEPWSAKIRSSLLQREDEQLSEERLVSVTPSRCYGICDETTPQRRSSLSDGSPAQTKRSLAKATSTTPRTRYKPGTLALRTHRAHSNTLARHTRSSSSPLSYADNGIDLTLADITDFDLCQKTAQLMAVAPGLPVADLYHLLMERGGQFEATKQEVIRASQAPRARPSQYRPNANGRAAVVPCASPIDDQEEEKYIKIDLDDPAFMWDNDAPATPPPEPCRRK
ncbi:hypothetical protein EJ07DRAFT_154342 [Lizonia empirigonia]|nr:hypothetical protein EJ07DRAFT_154342 [Lizonia empirigonia]